ncbi:hypothetical protein IWW36_002911 [Coemansia brasiliensis]|uniref:Uncharacterized protein n=1 Tax=Coemansia brasiliensis TaxID=2650707 RepID=A0A9W8I786_9FUNG|nr:hypothetical protein IWW36_002911 [Coemansia brasiliensis]
MQEDNTAKQPKLCRYTRNYRSKETQVRYFAKIQERVKDRIKEAFKNVTDLDFEAIRLYERSLGNHRTLDPSEFMHCIIEHTTPEDGSDHPLIQRLFPGIASVEDIGEDNQPLIKHLNRHSHSSIVTQPSYR